MATMTRAATHARLRHVLLPLVLAGLAASPALAQRIENKVAVFAALDKVTARISNLEVPLNETRQFGSLRLTPRVCYSRPPTEQPKTTTFVEIDETLLSGQETRLFTGWMFAESPGLNAVEHPVFDVWLTDCRDPVRPPPPTASVGPGPRGGGRVRDPAADFGDEPPPVQRRRPPR
jgi:hypothetical protein